MNEATVLSSELLTHIGNITPDHISMLLQWFLPLDDCSDEVFQHVKLNMKSRAVIFLQSEVSLISSFWHWFKQWLHQFMAASTYFLAQGKTNSVPTPTSYWLKVWTMTLEWESTSSASVFYLHLFLCAGLPASLYWLMSTDYSPLLVWRATVLLLMHALLMYLNKVHASWVIVVVCSFVHFVSNKGNERKQHGASPSLLIKVVNVGWSIPALKIM